MFAFGRNVLHQSGLRTTPLYYYNSQAMLVTFTLFRVLTIPILLYMLLTVIHTDNFYMLDRLGKALPFAAHCVMDVLNVRWLCKILRSVRRMMSTWVGSRNYNKNGFHSKLSTADGNQPVY